MLDHPLLSDRHAPRRPQPQLQVSALCLLASRPITMRTPAIVLALAPAAAFGQAALWGQCMFSFFSRFPFFTKKTVVLTYPANRWRPRMDWCQDLRLWCRVPGAKVSDQTSTFCHKIQTTTNHLEACCADKLRATVSGTRSVFPAAVEVTRPRRSRRSQATLRPARALA